MEGSVRIITIFVDDNKIFRFSIMVGRNGPGVGAVDDRGVGVGYVGSGRVGRVAIGDVGHGHLSDWCEGLVSKCCFDVISFSTRESA